MGQRLVLAAALVAAMLGSGRVEAQLTAEMAPDRSDIVDVGEPILISRKTLAAEMTRNSDLRDWVRLYGAPDYAEVQQIEIQPPFAPYEVRLYYLEGNTYLAFGRVHVAPSLYDYGVRKYIGHVNQADIDRLLTAHAAEDLQVADVEPAPEAPWLVETTAVDGKPIGQ
ncbi:MAG: hypothetical protein SF182_00045 [Deltaproteobacteria bacterium]|nr:hypothetical protein [Deltaproteobacteria bacterium]